MTAVGSGLVVVIIRVFRISGSESSRRLSGFHPRSLIAFLFVLIRPNNFGQIILINGKISDFIILHLNPFLFDTTLTWIFLVPIQLSMIRFAPSSLRPAICAYRLVSQYRIPIGGVDC